MEVIFTIIGLVIAGLTFYFTFYKKPTEEINNLKVQFKATQTLSLEVQNNIEKYASKTNSWNKLIFPNITFQSYLNQMKESYKENLSDNLYEKISKMDLTKPNIESMTKSLEQQFTALQEINVQTKLLLKQIDNKT